MEPAEPQDRGEVLTWSAEEVDLPGVRLCFRVGGQGPGVLLLHGLAADGTVWDGLAERLSRDHRVIVPDLPGHGGSRSRSGDHSLAVMATALRDLLVVLNQDRVTVIGHSLGGGVALHLAHQHPTFCERLLLVAPGGLGSEIHPALRAMSLPGSELVLAAWAAGTNLRRRLPRPFGPARPGGPPAPLVHPFLRPLRTVVGLKGQRVDALDALSVISRAIPTLLVWGEEDPILPISQARAAVDAAPTARLLTVAGAGHVPHLDDAEGFALVVRRFLSEPAGHADDRRWAEILSERYPRSVALQATGAGPA